MNKIFKTAMEFTGELMKHKIAFLVMPLYDGFKWVFAALDGDVVIHSGSYGNQEGFVESMGFSWDEVDVSIFDPEEMANNIAAEIARTH